MVDPSADFGSTFRVESPIRVNAQAELEEHGYGFGCGGEHDPFGSCLSVNSCSAAGVPAVPPVALGLFLSCFDRKDVETWLSRNGYSKLRGTNSILDQKLSSGVVSLAHCVYNTIIMSPPVHDPECVWEVECNGSLLKHQNGDYVHFKLNYEHSASSGTDSLWHFSNIVLNKGFPSSDNTNGGELVASIVTTDTNYSKNKTRLWFMPRVEEQYSNETPAPFKTVFDGDMSQVVFVGVAYYDCKSICHMMTKDEMRNRLTIKPAVDRSHTDTNEYLTFKTINDSERNRREFSLVAVKFPLRKPSGGSQSYFTMSIQFSEEAPSGMYEPVIFLLKDNGVTECHWTQTEGGKEGERIYESVNEYALVPVVKYNMIIVCSTPDSDARLITGNASTSSAQHKNHANASVTRDKKRTHHDNDYNNKVNDALYRLEKKVAYNTRIANILVEALGVPCDSDQEM